VCRVTATSLERRINTKVATESHMTEHKLTWMSADNLKKMSGQSIKELKNHKYQPHGGATAEKSQEHRSRRFHHPPITNVFSL